MTKRIRISKDLERFLAYETGAVEIPGTNPDEIIFEWEKKGREVGLLEWAVEEQRKIDYLNFYEDARIYYPTEFSEHAYEKAEILVNHFKRFKHDGRQPLFKENGRLAYDPIKIGVIYNKLYLEAKKVLEM